MKLICVLTGVLILSSIGWSQDSVDVTFRYLNPSASSVTLPGEFNGWNNAAWPNDPLNQHVNANDNNNSYIYVRDPTIYQVLPNQRNPLVSTATPTISAYLFPRVGGQVDTAAITLTIKGAAYGNLGTSYDSSSQLFTYHPATPLPNGDHVVILAVGLSADTVHFTMLAGYVQITNKGDFRQ